MRILNTIKQSGFKSGVNRHDSCQRNYSSLPSRFLLGLSLSTMMIFSSSASAEYSFQVVSPPGANFTQTFGINNAGEVVGNADDGVGGFAFIYDMKKGEYSTIDTEIGVLDISNSGVMVGNIEGVCAIRDKKGNVTTLFPPSYAVDSFCTARGVNSSGKVSGYEMDASGGWLGFTYDPKKDTYEEFLPSAQTIAHAINAQGKIAGSVFLDADEAYPGSAAGRYGFLRQKNGAVKYFAISQSFPGQSRARGISESGLVTGFYLDPDTFESKSYVTTLASGNGFQEITLTDDQIVYQKPCNPDVPPSPGPGYDFYTDMTSSQIRNDGVVVGSCTDYYYNATTDDFVPYGYGFIATPVK